MPFFGALDSTTASATTMTASTSITASPGTFRMGGTVGSTFKSFRWGVATASNVNEDSTRVVTVTLSPAMPDANYNVFLDPTVANNFLFSALVDNKTTTTFDMRVRKRGASGNNTVIVDYIVIDF
jgi:hypothetical protein